MNRPGTGLAYVALVLSIIALISSLMIYSTRPRTAAETAAQRPKATVSLCMVVATFAGEGVFAHRWYPTRWWSGEGDTVDLAIANPDRFSHQFEMTAYHRTTDVLKPGASARLTFAADEVGVFEYRCILPHDPAKGHCTPDHDQMRGYLIVTSK